MSKRAEEAGLKAYPFNGDYRGQGGDNIGPRSIYQQGYEKAEKDTIERAVMWLEKHADNYNGSESAFDHMEEEMITDFRKAMEDG